MNNKGYINNEVLREKHRIENYIEKLNEAITKVQNNDIAKSLKESTITKRTKNLDYILRCHKSEVEVFVKYYNFNLWTRKENNNFPLTIGEIFIELSKMSEDTARNLINIIKETDTSGHY